MEDRFNVDGVIRFPLRVYEETCAGTQGQVYRVAELRCPFGGTTFCMLKSADGSLVQVHPDHLKVDVFLTLARKAAHQDDPDSVQSDRETLPQDR